MHLQAIFFVFLVLFQFCKPEQYVNASLGTSSFLSINETVSFSNWIATLNPLLAWSRNSSVSFFANNTNGHFRNVTKNTTNLFQNRTTVQFNVTTLKPPTGFNYTLINKNVTTLGHNQTTTQYPSQWTTQSHNQSSQYAAKYTTHIYNQTTIVPENWTTQMYNQTSEYPKGTTQGYQNWTTCQYNQSSMHPNATTNGYYSTSSFAKNGSTYSYETSSYPNYSSTPNYSQISNYTSNHSTYKQTTATAVYSTAWQHGTTYHQSHWKNTEEQTTPGSVSTSTDRSVINPIAATTFQPISHQNETGKTKFAFNSHICDCQLHWELSLVEIDYVCCNNKTFSEITEHQPNAAINEVFTLQINDTANQTYWFMENNVKILHIYDSELRKLPPGLEKVYIVNSKVTGRILDEINKSTQLDTIHLESILIMSRNSSNTTEILAPQRADIFPLFKLPFTKSHLISVSFVNCNISSLAGVNLLQNASNLKMLSLAQNKLHSIDNPNFFPSSQVASHFWHLDLSYNLLANLTTWKIPSTIRSLNLANNRFTQLHFFNFKYVWSRDGSLNEFWIEENALNCTNNTWTKDFINNAEFQPMLISGFKCTNQTSGSNHTIVTIV